MFKNAIVRVPCSRIKEGLSTSGLGKPDYYKAIKQHSEYIDSLRYLGLAVKVLVQDELYPDSTFVEDVALCTPSCAIITNPGAISRRGETNSIKPVLEEYYNVIEEISLPGTLEAGDVMKVDNHFFIGISERTNCEGADQLIRILEKHSMTGTKIRLERMLHLKTGVSYLENNNILVFGEFIDKKEFKSFNRIIIDENESYAANSLWINGIVIVPDGYPKTREKIEKAGYKTIALDLSEFRKVDGGLSCLSLRF